MKFDIWDVHVHPRYAPPPHKPKDIVKEVLEEMERCDVAKVVLSPANWSDNLTNEDYHGANTEISKSIKKHREKFFGFCRISPKFPGAIEELERSITSLGMQGVKLHPAMDNFYPNSPEYFQIYEKIVKLEVPVLFHTNPPHGEWKRSSPVRILKVAQSFLQMKIILAHILSAPKEIRLSPKKASQYTKETISKAKDLSNVYLDTSQLKEKEKLEFAVEKLGANRILFGSDYKWGKMDETIEVILESNLSEHEKKSIFQENLQTLMTL